MAYGKLRILVCWDIGDFHTFTGDCVFLEEYKMITNSIIAMIGIFIILSISLNTSIDTDTDGVLP